MPKATRTSGGSSTSARAEPYPKKSPKDNKKKKANNSSAEEAEAEEDNKENVTPPSKSTTSKTAKSTAKSTTAEPTFDSNWRFIPLEQKKGEVPCYEKASVVRGKLNKLIQGKAQIPGSKKKWSQASMVEELKGLEQREGRVADETGHHAELNAKQMGKFLKQSGGMGGGG